MAFNMSQMMSGVDHGWEVEETATTGEKKDKNNETRLNQNPAWNNLITLSVYLSVSKDNGGAVKTAMSLNLVHEAFTSTIY